MIHLRSIEWTPFELPNSFPFSVPLIRNLGRLEFTQSITFFVGENGTGKSTLLETIALAAQLPTIGSEPIERDETLAALRPLAQALRWSWNKRTRRGFFMRAEDFFGYAKRLSQTRQVLQDDLNKVQQEGQERAASSLSQALASLPMRRELHALQQSYGAGLDAQSHGESFFKLFQARFVPNGLYILDEPEAALSPMRQMALLALLRQMIQQGAQFLIASHSPVLLAYPQAQILLCDGRLRPASYEALEHVRLMRDFLANPQAYLRHLLDDEAEPD